MNMPEVKCFFSLEDGTVLKLPPGDQGLATARAEPDTYRPIDAVPSRIQYQWLDAFIASVEEDALRDRMLAAINGKGAFRRFKDILLTVPDERRRWFEFRDVAMRDRIIEWVREQGAESIDEPDWSSTSTAAPSSNQQHDLEALRDFLIAWVDEWAEGKGVELPLSPMDIEAMAQAVSEAFRVKPGGE